MIDPSLVDRLKNTVNSLGLSQQELAKLTGIHQSQISRMLAGDVRRVSRNLLKLRSCIDGLHRNNANIEAVPKILEDAIRFSWNGTTQHAEALARVIISLKDLSSEEVRLDCGGNHG